MLKPLGDSALLVQLGDEIHPALNARIHALNALMVTGCVALAAVSYGSDATTRVLYLLISTGVAGV